MKEPITILHEQLRPKYGDSIKNVTLLHIDETGYWFQFSLTNDERLQTWCVRHSDLKQEF